MNIIEKYEVQNRLKIRIRNVHFEKWLLMCFIPIFNFEIHYETRTIGTMAIKNIRKSHQTKTSELK